LKCQANPKCKAFSWDVADPNTPRCYLKSQGSQNGRSGRVSAFVNTSCSCTTGAGPAPKCWDCHPGPKCCASPSPPQPPHGPPPSPPGESHVLEAYRCLDGGPDSALPHCDRSKTLAERVESIVSNLTAEEMVDIQLKNPVPRLQISSYAMWSTEALHGVRLWPERCPFPDRCTTIFPTASASARAFNTSLWEATGEAMGTEGRVLWNLGIVNDLSLRGPQVNIQRDRALRDEREKFLFPLLSHPRLPASNPLPSALILQQLSTCSAPPRVLRPSLRRYCCCCCAAVFKFVRLLEQRGKVTTTNYRSSPCRTGRSLSCSAFCGRICRWGRNSNSPAGKSASINSSAGRILSSAQRSCMLTVHAVLQKIRC
jgi:hypothetical protein